jgi:hypothetical protein
MTMTSGKASRRRKLFLAALAGLSTLISCSPWQTTTTGGSGSETQNAYVVISDNGRLYGTAGPHDRAGAFNVFYVPYEDSGFDTTVSSDDSGVFDFSVLDSGSYNVLVADPVFPVSAFLQGVRVGPGIGPDTFASYLGPVGSISGTVTDTAGLAYPQLPAYIPGSPFFDISNHTGFFSITDVPSGRYMILTKDVISRGKNDTLSADTAVSVSAGESLSIHMLMLNK